MGSSILSVPILAAVLAGMLVAVIAVVRAIPPRPELSPEERAEMANAPMSLLAKRAWLGLAISTVTLVVIAVILFTKGAAAYWDNDDLRSLVVGIFLVGMLGYVFAVPVVLAFDEERGRLDERDASILRRAATVQWATVILTLAAWLTALPKMFHSEGAVPVVYLYLMFGSVLLVSLFGQALGILIGNWWAVRRG